MSQKKTSRNDRKNLNDLIGKGIVTPRNSRNKRKGFEIREVADQADFGQTYPGFDDKPSTSGIQYAKHVDTTPFANVWEAVSHELYASGGFPIWIVQSTSILDRMIYWQLVHYQNVFANNAYPSTRTLSRNCGVHYRSIQRSLQTLVSVGLIQQVKASKGVNPVQYKIVLPTQLSERSPLLRRNDSGFSKKESEIRDKSSSLEVTDGTIEVTAQTARGDHADTQKTKLSKSVVSEVRASALPANTPQKKNTPSDLDVGYTVNRTIGEAEKVRNKKIQREKITSKPKKFRSFFQHEASPHKIEASINECPPLRKQLDAVITLAGTAGGFNQAQERVEDHSFIDESKVFFDISSKLQRGEWDVSNLEKAVSELLRQILFFLQIKSDAATKESLDFYRSREIEAKNQERIRIEAEKRLKEEEARNQALLLKRQIQVEQAKQLQNKLIERAFVIRQGLRLTDWFVKSVDIFAVSEAFKDLAYMESYFHLESEIALAMCGLQEFLPEDKVRLLQIWWEAESEQDLRAAIEREKGTATA